MGRRVITERFLSTYASNEGTAYPFPPASTGSTAAASASPACPKAPLVQPSLLPVPEPAAAEDKVYKWSEKPFDPDAELCPGAVFEAFLPRDALADFGPKPADPVAPTPAQAPAPALEGEAEDARALLRDISASPPRPSSPSSLSLVRERSDDGDKDSLDLDLTLELSDSGEDDGPDEEEGELAGVDVLELARRAEAYVRAQQERGAAGGAFGVGAGQEVRAC